MRIGGRHTLLLVVAFLLAAGFVLYGFGQATASAVSSIIAAALQALSLILQARQPYSVDIEEATEQLAKIVEAGWAQRKAILLDRVPAIDIGFHRTPDLEAGQSVSAPPRGSWKMIGRYYRDCIPQRLVITGTPASGKSLLALHLVTELLHSRDVKRAQQGLIAGARLRRPFSLLRREPPTASTSRVPVPISVAGWDGGIELDSWLVDRLTEIYGFNTRVARGLVRAGRVLAVLDGLDETFWDGNSGESRYDKGDPTRATIPAETILQRLNSVFTSRGLAPVVITCRSDFYDQLAERIHDTTAGGLCDAVVIRMDSLSPAKTMRYIKELPTLQGDSKSLQQLQSDSGRFLVASISSPLILTMVARVMETGSSTIAEMSDAARSDSLENILIPSFLKATVSIFPKSVGTYRVFKRLGLDLDVTDSSKASHYEEGEVCRWLTTIASYVSARESVVRIKQTKASSAEFQPHELWQVASSYGHHSRAWHAVIAVTAGVIMGTFGLELYPGWLGVFGWSVATTVGVYFGARAGLTRTPAPSKVDLVQFMTADGRRLLLPVIAMATVAGIVGFLVSNDPTIGIAKGIAGGAFVALLTCFGRGVLRLVEPWEPIKNDLRFGIYMGIVCGIAIGLPGGIAGGIVSERRLDIFLPDQVSAMLAFFISLPCCLALASRAWLRLYISLLLLRKEKALPLRLQPFLRWAYMSGLLRISGIGYQFRHDWIRRSLVEGASRSMDRETRRSIIDLRPGRFGAKTEG